MSHMERDHIDLNFEDLDVLERQLQAGEHLDDLQVLVDYRYPHYEILHRYQLAYDPVAKQRWAACLFKLIELKAPTDYSNFSAALMLLCMDWEQPELTRSLAQRYLETGYIAADRPLPGVLSDPEEYLRYTTGMLPLAAAINYRNLHGVQFLLDNGASLDVGPVVEGGPRLQALECARECGATDIEALLLRLTDR
ncbi:MAG: hypothetical protein ACOZE7_20575 [Pseudomonadota bacterium]